MKILLIEDTSPKAEECIAYLESADFKYKWIRTEKDAKTAIKSDESFDLVLLDMELITSSAKGAPLERYSGIRILNCMRIYGIDTPVILITAYWDMVNMKQGTDIHLFCNDIYFNRPADPSPAPQSGPANRQIKNLEDMHLFLCRRYKNYLGAVEYSKMNSLWKRNLGNLIAQYMEGEHK